MLSRLLFSIRSPLFTISPIHIKRNFSHSKDESVQGLKNVFGAFLKNNRVASQFWTKHENVTHYLQYVGGKLNVNQMEDWYAIKTTDLLKYNGSGLVTGNTMFKILVGTFKDHEWMPWRFNPIPNNTWADENTQRKFLQYLGDKLGYKSMADYYQLRTTDMEVHGGSTLLAKFGHSPVLAVQQIFPDHVWQVWKFSHSTSGYFDIHENQLKYMTYLGEEMGVKKMEDWYQIDYKWLVNHFGTAIYEKFSSPSRIVMEVFRDHIWMPWMFRVIPRNCWDSAENRINYFKYLGDALGYKSMDYWYTVTSSDFHKHNGDRLLARYSLDIPRLLKEMFPHHNWQLWRFKPVSGWSIEERIEFVKDLGTRLGYTKMEDWYTLAIQDLDTQGKALLKLYGSKATMISSIFHENPWDLAKLELGGITAVAKPNKKHWTQKSTTNSVPTPWKQSADPSCLLMQENFVGVRAIWDGKNFILQNNEIAVRPPALYTFNLPKNEILDGVFWMGRKVAIDPKMLLRTSDRKWLRTRFILLDVLTEHRRELPQKERMSFLNSIAPSLPRHVSVAATVVCESRDHFDQFCYEIVQKNGEGVILRHPDTPYGCSEGIKEHKVWETSEVKMLSLSKTSTSLICETSLGQQVSVQCSSDIYNNAPAPGSIISAKHSHYRYYFLHLK